MSGATIPKVTPDTFVALVMELTSRRDMAWGLLTAYVMGMAVNTTMVSVKRSQHARDIQARMSDFYQITKLVSSLESVVEIRYKTKVELTDTALTKLLEGAQKLNERLNNFISSVLVAARMAQDVAPEGPVT